MSTTHLYLVLRLRMSGVIPPLTLYLFMAWKESTLYFYFGTLLKMCVCVCVCVCLSVHFRIGIKTPVLLTYLLTPWSRVLFEKLTGSAASQEITRIFGTRKFLTVLTSARHLSLSWVNSIQYPQLPPTSWRSTLILSSHLRLGKVTVERLI